MKTLSSLLRMENSKSASTDPFFNVLYDLVMPPELKPTRQACFEFVREIWARYDQETAGHDILHAAIQKIAPPVTRCSFVQCVPDAFPTSIWDPTIFAAYRTEEIPPKFEHSNLHEHEVEFSNVKALLQVSSNDYVDPGTFRTWIAQSERMMGFFLIITNYTHFSFGFISEFQQGVTFQQKSMLIDEKLGVKEDNISEDLLSFIWVMRSILAYSDIHSGKFQVLEQSGMFSDTPKRLTIPWPHWICSQTPEEFKKFISDKVSELPKDKLQSKAAIEFQELNMRVRYDQGLGLWTGVPKKGPPCDMSLYRISNVEIKLGNLYNAHNFRNV